jgi:hypothetical protein
MAEYIGQLLYIKPTMIVSVPEFDTPKNLFSVARMENAKNLRINKHNNKLSHKAIQRIKTAINWLIVSAKEKKVFHKASGKYFKFKVNLVTLTLPDTTEKVTEQAFKKKLIHPFLVYMKKFYGLKNYVWKVEFQKNGKLHLHITTDTFINHAILRHYWNSLLKKNGFLNDFIKKHKHDNPNSTDVHSVWKVKNLGAYIAKYMSKNSDSEEIINGRIWGCNYELSDKNKCVLGFHRDEVGAEMRELFKPQIKYKDIVNKNSKTGLLFRSAEIFFIELSQWGKDIKGRIKNAYDQHRFKIREALPFTDITYEV